MLTRIINLIKTLRFLFQLLIKKVLMYRILTKKLKVTTRYTLENECELKRFNTCAVYLRVRPFWIYTTVSFFKTFSPLLLCVCVCVCVKICSILQKRKRKKIHNTDTQNTCTT